MTQKNAYAEWLYTPGRRGSVEERFWRSVERGGEEECWPWTGIPSSRGYGRMHTPIGGSTPAHHVAVMLHGLSIPQGQVVDHICRNRLCQNPAHLRVVDPVTNTLENSASVSAANKRKTHCKRGHEFTPDNIVIIRTGRNCRKCRALHEAKYRASRGQKTFRKPEFAAHLEQHHAKD